LSFLHRNVLGISLAIAAIGLVVAACTPVPPFFEPTAPPDVREACKLTERRCTACHDRDRIVDAHYSRDEWPIIVERMRQMPGSTIAPTETDTILHCLLNRTESARPQ
jgi:hypothetical protein